MNNHATTDRRNRKSQKFRQKSILVLLIIVAGSFLLRQLVFERVKHSDSQDIVLLPKKFSEQANQVLQEVLPKSQQVPLILQRDERWG